MNSKLISTIYLMLALLPALLVVWQLFKAVKSKTGMFIIVASCLLISMVSIEYVDINLPLNKTRFTDGEALVPIWLIFVAATAKSIFGGACCLLGAKLSKERTSTVAKKSKQ